MDKKTGNLIGVILGILAFIGAVAVVAYLFRDKIAALCGRKGGCECDECDCDDDHDYFEIDDCDCDCDCCDCCDCDGADDGEEAPADGEGSDGE